MKINSNSLLMVNTHHLPNKCVLYRQITLPMLIMGKVKVSVVVSTRRHIRHQMEVMFKVLPTKHQPVFQKVFVL